jgi:hypothetical protein
MGEIDKRRQINAKNWCGAEQNLRFSEMRWIFEISKYIVKKP